MMMICKPQKQVETHKENMHNQYRGLSHERKTIPAAMSEPGTVSIHQRGGRSEKVREEKTLQDYILIAEDDNDINQMLAELLNLNNYHTVSAFSGTEALLHVKMKAPAAVILDLMLPGMKGEQVLDEIKRENPEVAVLVISAKDGVNTRISLLRAGADDYLTKPFDTEELLARLEAILRRSGKRSAAGSGCPETGGKTALYYKDITMYPEDFSAFVGEKELLLTKREYQILALLMENPGKVFTKSNIYESVWNEEFLGEDNAVNVHISNIRQKLSRLHPKEAYIQTVWGIGFKMN